MRHALIVCLSLTGLTGTLQSQVMVDRFSAKAGHLQMRTADNGIPAANAPVDFDHGPFVTHGLDPAGHPVTYYNFDVQKPVATPIYVLVHSGMMMVEHQLPIVSSLPGDDDYSDFHQIVHVTVPADYKANAVMSAEDVMKMGWTMEKTTTIANDVIVSDGSHAKFAKIEQAYYKGHKVHFLAFEQDLKGDMDGHVPVSPIFVTFVKNPNEPNGGPASGFKMESGSMQTHNVVATIPGQLGYSPLWQVSVYDNMAFPTVHDLASVSKAKILGPNVATVNCPIIVMGMAK